MYTYLFTERGVSGLGSYFKDKKPLEIAIYSFNFDPSVMNFEPKYFNTITELIPVRSVLVCQEFSDCRKDLYEGRCYFQV